MKAFIRPSLNQIYERVSKDIDSRLGTKRKPKITLVDVLAKAIAGLSHSLHGHIEYLSKAFLPDGATGIILERWAAIFGIYRKRASKATGTVIFNPLIDDATIPAKTKLQSNTGIELETLETSKAVNGRIEARVISVEAGDHTNLMDLDVLSLTSPLLGVKPTGIIGEGGISGGADQESDTNLRRRLLERIRNPPQGGSVTDYILWAKEIPGVTRVFVYPMRRGAGSVDVAFVLDGKKDILPDPTSEIFKQVSKRLKEKAPITADVKTISLTKKPITLKLKVSPDTDEVKEAVTEEIEELLRFELAKGAVRKKQILRVSRLREAISQARGEEYHTLIYPTKDITASETEIITLGGIEWES